jgi:predicted Fe-S protein YdhL (DUF1289 family)
MTDAAANPVQSPCIKICKLNERQICIACGRSLDEIANWSRLSDEARRAVCAAALERVRLQTPPQG